MGKGLVCVTGASGFIGSWLVMRLLERGYRVRATIMPQLPETEVSHLYHLPLAKENLEIVEADLCVEGSFDDPVKDCVGVFHVATPTNFWSQDPENEVIEPTVRGALGILKACIKAKTVRRLVYTSSAATLNMQGKKFQGPLDEHDWSSIEFCRQEKMLGWVYFVAKTLAEKALLEQAKSTNFDLVTVLPSLVVGPFLGSSLNPINKPAFALFYEKKLLYEFLKSVSLIHVEDLVSAHIELFENQSAKGRYICSACDSTLHQLASMLHHRYPEYNIPTKFEGYEEEEKPVILSSKKLLHLGFKFRYTLEDMFDDAIDCCRKKGILFNKIK